MFTRREFVKLSIMAAITSAFLRLFPKQVTKWQNADIPFCEFPMHIPFAIGPDVRVSTDTANLTNHVYLPLISR